MISIPLEVRRDLFISIFIQAETEALEIDIVRKTFAEVGLWPWNPTHILELCQEHYCRISELKLSPLVRKLLCIVRNIKQQKLEEAHQLLRKMKRVRVEIVRKGVKKKGQVKNLWILWKAKNKMNEKKWMKLPLIALSKHPQSAGGKCNAVKNNAVQKGARRHIFGQRNGRNAPSVKETSALLMRI